MTLGHMRIACWITKATNTQQNIQYLYFFYFKNGCTKAPKYYIICTLPILFKTDKLCVLFCV